MYKFLNFIYVEQALHVQSVRKQKLNQNYHAEWSLKTKS